MGGIPANKQSGVELHFCGAYTMKAGGNPCRKGVKTT